MPTLQDLLVALKLRQQEPIYGPIPDEIRAMPERGTWDRLKELGTEHDIVKWWENLTTPLTDVGARVGRAIDEPRLSDQYAPWMPYIKGALSGVAQSQIEGVTSPLGVAVSTIPLARTAKGLYNAAMSVGEPVAGEISKDVYGLSRGPMGRRNFFYRASGAPEKLARARVAASPNVVEGAAKQLQAIEAAHFPENFADRLEGMTAAMRDDPVELAKRGLTKGLRPKMTSKGKKEILDKVRDEASMVEALQNRYGMLNQNPKLSSKTNFGKELVEDSYTWDSAPGTHRVGTEAGKIVSDLRGAISDTTARKMKDQLDLLSRASDRVGKKQIRYEDVSPGEAAAADALRAQSRIIEDRYRKQLDKIGFHDPQWEEIVAKRREETQPLWEKIWKLDNSIWDKRRAMEAAMPIEAQKTDPIAYMSEAIDNFNKRLNEIAAGPPKRFINQGINQTGGGKKAVPGKTNRRRTKEEIARLWSMQRGIAEATLRKQAAQFGGPEGELIREMVEAHIAGRPIYEEGRDTMVKAIADNVMRRFGVDPDKTLEVAGQTKDVYDASKKVARAFNPSRIVIDFIKRNFRGLGE